MCAWAARAGAATVISNLDPDHAVWYFYGVVNAATVILNSNSLSGELFPGRNYAIPGSPLLPGHTQIALRYV